MPQEVDRFTSFAERYIVARAATFAVGNEKQGAWIALLDAEAIYKMIGQRTAARNNGEPNPAPTQGGWLAGVDRYTAQLARDAALMPK